MLKVTSRSPLQLEAANVTGLTFELDDRALLESGVCARDAVEQYDTTADFDVYHARAEDEGAAPAHLVTLELVLRRKKGDSSARFTRLEIKLHGVFRPDVAFDDDVIRQVIPGNCLAILHGLARGIVTAATSSCPGGPFLLPTVNYQDLIRKKRQALRRQAAREAAEAAPEPE